MKSSLKKKMHLITHQIADFFPLAWALRQTFRKGYTLSAFKQDFFAAIVVSMIALPLSMALAIAVGLPPQHGIYTAIVAGITAALLGGSSYQISGPTAAFVVILIPIVADLGLRGLIWCQILAGFILILLAFAKLGKLIHYIPYPVTTGFTSGIALVLAILSLKDFLGLNIDHFGQHFIEKVSVILTHLSSFDPYAALIGLTTLLLITQSKKFIKKIPAPILGVLGGTLLGILLTKNGLPVKTIGTEFHFLNSIPLFHLPNFTPGDIFSFPSLAELKMLISPALIIAALAALETLLSASIADSLTQTRHHPNAELHGIGFANILSGLACGVPATAAIARTATNIYQGANSPFAAVLQGLLILVYVSLFSSVIQFIPMATLAALLLLTAYNMSHIKQGLTILRIAPSADRIVFIFCFSLTVFIDMVAGVSVGIVLAALLFMKRIAALTSIEFTQGLGSTENKSALPTDVMIFKIEGPLFFGTVEKAYNRTNTLNHHIKTVIVDMEKVPFIDMTGLVAMKSVLDFFSKNCQVYLCGQPEILNKVLKKLPSALRSKITISDSVSTLQREQKLCST